MRRHVIASLILLLLPVCAHALPPQRGGVPARHYILDSAVPLDAAASAELGEQGIEVQQALGSHRYLVRMRDGLVVPATARIRSLRAYDASRKIARAAYDEAAQGKAFARLRVLFQSEVTFEEAQSAIEEAGGAIETPFALASASPQRLTVRVPSTSVIRLAEDERVFGIYGPPLHPSSLNAVAALISNVTPLYTAPYSLTGTGVVMSIFEPDGHPDVTHQEFGGRVINHFDASRPIDAHATHTTGTITAAGLLASAKGMAPTATLHAFDIPDLFDDLIVAKAALPSFSSVADNNSWDFALSWQGNVWYGFDEGLGGYSALESAPYDGVMRSVGEPLIVHAAGNDATKGNPSLTLPWSPHQHFNYDINVNAIDSHTFCYSQDGSGTDCASAPGFSCSEGSTYCEKTKHPTHGANTTIGLLASTKNALTVGAIQPDGVTIASFSSRGPTVDGRIKPEVVAKGTNQFSTFPNNGYSSLQGTSMSAPVVTGIAGLLSQQYRRMLGRTPSASILKTLIIAGADDLGVPGPDFTFGFGLADARASVDLIIADAGTGSRIRTGAIGNGQDVDIPMSLSAPSKFRVVLGWFDPQVVLTPDPNIPDDDPFAGETLVNDLDLRVVDPTGAIVLPYVLDPSTPSALATRAVNHADTTEEVEIANAIPGTYHVIVHGAIGDTKSSSQDYVVVMNAGVPCVSDYSAVASLASGQVFSANICGATDVERLTFTSNSLSPISVVVTATDTPLKVTVSSSASVSVTQTIAANSSTTLNAVINTSTFPTPNVQFVVRVEPNGTVGATGAYTIKPVFGYMSTPRKRSARK